MLHIKAIQRLAVSYAVLARLPAAMLAICILAVVVIYTAGAAPSGPTIVLIGGDKQGYPRTEHDYPDGILAIERLIKGSPQLQAVNPVVKSFPTGFPSDLSQIADADVILLYFGMGYGTPMTHTLDNAPRRAAVERLMAKGAGLIALHQASTVPDEKSAVPFADWLGGVRFGMADRSTEIASVRIAGAGNPIANGLKAFDYLDEFYPTVTFSKTTKVTPILAAKVHVQTRNNQAVFEEPAADHVIGWAAERPNGGRSFGFTGAHYLLTFDQPQIRTTLLNAILWTAKRDVPAGGATTNAPSMPHGGGRGGGGPTVPAHVVLTKAEALVEPQPWGKLEWFASRALGNSTTMTVGIATISAGKENPLHRHPNCVEILHVLQGHIMNRVADKEYDMRAGDTVTIPENTPHNARNIGTDDAVLSITYSSPDRISIGEK